MPDTERWGLARSAPASDLLVWLLTRKLRVMDAGQVAAELFQDASNPARAARLAIYRLRKRQLLETSTTMTHSVLRFGDALVDWSPGDGVPDFNRTAWQLQSRWNRPPVKTQLVWASSLANRMFGGVCGGRPPRAKEISHDIHVAQLFFHLQRGALELSEHWMHEDQLRREGWRSSIPDAVIRLPYGKEILIEFGGSYDARKLRIIHENYSTRGRYQIW